MATPVDLYPLSTPDGKSIPLDVIRPVSFMQVNFSDTASNLTAIDSANLLVLFATEDCFVRFGSTALMPILGTSYTDTVFIDKRFHVIVKPTASTISAIGTKAGILRIQTIDVWKGLGSSANYTRV